MDAYTILVIMHIMGTVLGVGGATFIEFHLTMALKDKVVSKEEGTFLALDYKIVRIGLALGLISGFGFLLLYKVSGQTFRLYDPMLWAKISVVLIIALNALLLQAHKISLYWGAALSFVSWWSALVIGIFTTQSVKINFFGSYGFLPTYVSVILLYIVLVVCGAWILHRIRERISRTQMAPNPLPPSS